MTSSHSEGPGNERAAPAPEHAENEGVRGGPGSVEESAALLEALSKEGGRAHPDKEGDAAAAVGGGSEDGEGEGEDVCYGAATAPGGISVKWYSRLEDVPEPTDAYQMVVAHEFFDALPVHQFEMTQGEWRERLVYTQAAPSGLELPDGTALPASDQHPFRFILASGTTGAEQVATQLRLLPPAEDESASGQRREVCLEAWRVCREISRRLQAGKGGAGLVFDYGDIAVNKDTLRAFRDHKETHIFDGPVKKKIKPLSNREPARGY